MKKRLLFFMMFLAAASFAWAQQDVSGTVTSAEDGSPLPGVTVLIVGTTQGTVTDVEGNYKISVPEGATLRFSYIGYKSQEINVGSRSVIDITLEPDVSQLDEVVVTALGVERETKALGYSVTEIEGDEFQDARTNNLAEQLEGRIAGVNVSKIASGPAGSTRVIIRGNKSLLGNNQPLYVVDGIPMDNSQFGQAGIWGGRDEGDGMSSINPDDIASITVLKGANAAALYGARAANGVVNIVTKKGGQRQGIGVDYTSNFVFEKIYDLREYQKEYGQGGFVRVDPSDPDSEFMAVPPRTQQESRGWNANSWGPRLGSGTFIDINGQERPYVDAGDNWPRFYETGWSLTNTLALTGGSAEQNFRVSFSDLRNESIVPNSGFERQNISLSTNSKFGEKLTFISKVLYSHEYARNRPYLSDSPANGILAMYYVPTNTDVDWFRGDPNKLGAVPPDAPQSSLSVWQKDVGEELPAGSHNWHQNPWWVAYQFNNDDWRDRFITSGQLRYDITDWLWVQGRMGMDWYTRRETDLVPQGTSYQRGGSINEGESRVREINMEWMAGFNRNFGPISLNAFVGGNRMRRSWEDLNLSGNGFNVPFFEAINNSVVQNWGYGFNESGINSLFGSLEVGYNNFLFLTGTARQDWFSVLNPENNNVLYPSIGGSFVFSDAIEMPDVISFGKIRASWAQVGNATINPYATNLTYSLKQAHLGYTMASFSQAGGRTGNIPNPGLQPLTSTEIEFGVDMRFLLDRIGIDLTYYNQKTEDDILNATISRSSGFATTSVNIGELRNRGLEVLLRGSPLVGNFAWDISLNMAKNDNEVVSLIEGNTELTIEEPRSRNAFIKHIVGHPFGVITGRVQKLSPDGQPVFFDNGRPVQEEGYHIIGNGVPDLTGGVNNSFTYKNFNLSFLVDFKAGGDILSGTNMRLTSAGLTEYSLQGREGRPPLSVSGVTQTGEDSEGNPIYAPFEYTFTPSQAQNYMGWIQSETAAKTDEFLYDASFVKLRQIKFGYIFPRELLGATPFRNVSLSFIGRNLWIIHKNTPNIDPESSYQSGNGQGLDYFGFPSTRSYGFDLKLQF